MRDLDERDLIAGDFLVVSGDVVANLDLGPALARHRARREKDKNAIMTMILREAGMPVAARAKHRRPVFVIDHRADRCIHYEEVGGRNSHGKRLLLDADFFSAHGEIDIREDLLDCRIDICTTDVLAQWSENFDYQSLRRSFLFGVLKDYELNGKTIHTHIVNDQYAARVKDLQSYGDISRDVARRWTFPYCPDANFVQGQNYQITGQKCYVEDRIRLARTAVVQGRSVVGSDTVIQDGATISRSSIGRRCKIGCNVRIEDSYIWDDVTIEDDTTILTSVIASHSSVGANCKIGHGSLISFETKVPPSSTISSDSASLERRSNMPTASESTAIVDSDSDSDVEAHSLYLLPQSRTSSQTSISTLTSQKEVDTDSDFDDEIENLHRHRRPSSGAASDTSRGTDSNAPGDPPTILGPGQTAKSAAAAADAVQAFHSEATASILDGLQKGDKADTIFLELNGYRMSVDASQHTVRSAVVTAFLQRVNQLIHGISRTDDDGDDDGDEVFTSKESAPNSPSTTATANGTRTSSKSPKLTKTEAIKQVFGTYTLLLERVLLVDRTSNTMSVLTAAQPTAPLSASASSSGPTDDQVDFLLEVQKICAHWPPTTTTTTTTTHPNTTPDSSTDNTSQVSQDTKNIEGQNILVLVAKEMYDLDLLEENAILKWWDDDRSNRNSKMETVKGLTGAFITFLREADEEEEEEDDDDDDDSEDGEGEDDDEE